MKRIGMLGLVLVLITLVSLGSMTIAQGPDRQGGHKLPVAPETPATEEPAEEEAADAWEPDLGVVEVPDRRAGAYSFVGGGRKNKADGAYSSVVGGYNNTAKSKYATIGGGQHNWCKGWRSTISGGRDNETQAEYATVGGGRENKARKGYTTVGGGYSNQATDDYATVGGGEFNTASGDIATVGGGLWNTASGAYATVGGGCLHAASGSYATVGGGGYNTASGTGATVGGGYGNTASGDYSFAAGLKAVADDNGAFVWGDSTAYEIHSGGANQFIVRANGGVWFGKATTNYTPAIGAGVYIATSTGGYLSTGGAWTNSSDRQAKENIEVVDAQDVLDRLVVVPISTWNYIAQDATVQHMGPMAQDFHAAFGLGEDDRHIAALDLGGANTAAIQALYRLVQELETEDAALREQMTQLQAENAALREQVARLAALETRG